jgi:colanic acid/amylovoran biosynthesis glycosyltransferase
MLRLDRATRGNGSGSALPTDPAGRPARKREPAPRLAYVVGLYPAISHTFILREVEGLRRRGFTVTTLSIHTPGPAHMPAAADRSAFASTYYLSPPRIADHLRAHCHAITERPLAYLSSLASAVRSADPGVRSRLRQLAYFAEAVVVWWRCSQDGVSHVHGEFCGPASDAAMLAARLGGARWTWSFAAHGTDILQVSRARLGRKLRAATFVVCASEFGRSQLMSLTPSEEWGTLEVIRCGVDVDIFQPPPEREAPSEHFRILTVGRLEHEKGQALLLEAMAADGAPGGTTTLTLIGDGSDRERLALRAQRLGIVDRVSFLGRIGQDEIRSHYANADVFCLSSLGEGVPVVLMEAMAMGLPVVAPRLMGIPELVQDGVSGLLFTPGSACDLARALARLEGSPDLRAELGRAGRERIEREFEIDRCAAHLAELLERRIGRQIPV